MDLVRNRLNEYTKNPEIAEDFDDSMDDIEKNP